MDAQTHPARETPKSRRTRARILDAAMRLFAEEQKLGTLESLLTAPVRTWQVLLGKYFASVVFYIVLWLPVLLYFGVLSYVMRGKVEIPAGALQGSYLMILASGLFHLAMGCLASSLTKNQIIAAVLSFGIILLHFLAGKSLQLSTGQTLAVLQQQLGLVDASFTARVTALVKGAGLPVTGPKLGADRYLELMRVDKKAEGGQIKFVVIEQPGRAGVRGASVRPGSGRARRRG